MCGRTACALDKDTICQRCTLNPSSSNKPLVPRWDDKRSGHKYVPSYNLAPGSFTPVLVLGKFVGAESIVAIQPMHWGLVPSFAPKESSASFATSNARIESLLQKPSYGSSMRQGKRCVVLAQGFYEWKTTDGRKQPYYIYPSDPKKLLMMAGVFAFHEQKRLFSYSVITADSVGIVADVHHRMPVVLTTDDDVTTWLDPSVLNPQQAQAFLTRIASEAKLAPLSMHSVTQRMNSTKYDYPDCIAPLTELVDSKKSIQARGSSNLMIKFLKRSEEAQATQPSNKKQACDDACISVEKHEEKKRNLIKTETH
ncbi:hypothetical protein CRM22_008731 [Opisthorchis felineus]|uniref:Abasic site processing protein HMCES n=1 Tax=Opisthorchis felineus TaxID=147828 RepID=A0A4S2LBX5_OPIFE|nr:hypothetical protein CRM22_008731 [Opisthorchis felineus]